MKDSGIGINKEDQGRLFKSYGRIDHNESVKVPNNSEGIGLGLTIVRALVSSYGGKITFESEGLNQRTTFSFTMMMEEDNPCEPLYSLKTHITQPISIISIHKLEDLIVP